MPPPVVWLTGASRMTVEGALRKGIPGVEVSYFARGEDVPVEGVPAGKVVFAVGNLAGPGHALMKRVREEGTEYV